MIKLAIFDFDDTLSMTEEGAFHLSNEIGAELGFPPIDRVVHKQTWGRPAHEAISERIPGINVDEFMRRLGPAVVRYAQEGKIDVVPEKNVQILTKLREHEKRIAILTSRIYDELTHLLEPSHYLHTSVEKYYHADNMTFHKPDPRAFDQALFDFNVTPAEVVYVGDSIGDARSAKSAGLHFIALLESGLRTREDFNEHAVDMFAEKFEDIVPYIVGN